MSLTRNRKPTIKPILINGLWSIRFKYRGKQYQRSVGKPYPVGKVDVVLRKTQGICNSILFDIDLGQFDGSLIKYFPLPEVQKSIESIPVKVNPPVIELFKKFIDYKSKLVKQSTLSNYYFVLTALERVESWVTEFDLYSANDVKDFLLGDYGKPSVIIILQKLEACFDWAIDRKLIDIENPYKGIYKDIKVSKSSANPLSKEDQKSLIKGSDEPYKSLFTFLLLTGCRISEALALKWSDINSQCIHFRRTAREAKGGVFIEEELKTQSSRKFPIGSDLADLLKSIKLRNASQFLFGDSLQECPSEFVFNLEGKLIRYSYACKRLHKIFPNYTIHNLRDTFITEQISRGVPTAIVAQWVGNSIVMIEQRYLGLNAGMNVKPR